MANITQSEIIEHAKRDFQYSVSGLIDIHSEFQRKVNFAKANSKEFISFKTGEAEIIADLILQLAQELQGSYGVINKTITHVLTQNQILRATNISASFKTVTPKQKRAA